MGRRVRYDLRVTDLTSELNRDVWQPFRAAYAAGDADAFLDLHAPDLIRAGGPAKEVLDLAAYGAQVREWFALVAAKGDRLAIDFRFTERLVAGELASERGVYRITLTPATGDGIVLFGRFHTFARRIDGRWRIAVDYDSTGSGTVGPDDYATADDPGT